MAHGTHASLALIRITASGGGCAPTASRPNDRPALVTALS